MDHDEQEWARLSGWPAVMTVTELGQYLRISRGAAYDLVRSGAVAHLRIGRTIRIPRQALERLLAGHGPDGAP